MVPFCEALGLCSTTRLDGCYIYSRWVPPSEPQSQANIWFLLKGHRSGLRPNVFPFTYISSEIKRKISIYIAFSALSMGQKYFLNMYVVSVSLRTLIFFTLPLTFFVSCREWSDKAHCLSMSWPFLQIVFTVWKKKTWIFKIPWNFEWVPLGMAFSTLGYHQDFISRQECVKTFYISPVSQWMFTSVEILHPVFIPCKYEPCHEKTCLRGVWPG